MALLYDQETELKTLKTIVDGRVPEHHRAALLGKLSFEHFHDAACQAAFKRLSHIAKNRFEILTLREVVSDPSIDEDLRDVLRDNLRKMRPLRNRKELNAATHILDQYRKLRTVYQAAADTLDKFEEPEIDIDSITNKLADAVSKANSGLAEDQFYLHFGESDSSSDIIDRILLNEKAVRIPSGFETYDKENGGLPEQGVFIIAATTSGGKSTVAMNLCAHWYLKQNLSVAKISLEMDDVQETRRLASHLTQIDFSKFVHGRLNMQDKQLVKKKMEEFTAHGKKHGIRYTSLSPTRSMTIDDAFAAVSPFGYKIIAIDYIGLLAGMDASSQWFQLSEVTAQAKRFSRAHNCLVVLLAQLDSNTDQLRYAKGIQEHADTMWRWNYSKQEQRDLHILPIDVAKDRDGKVFQFELAERYDVMTAEDIAGDSGGSYSPAEDDEEDVYSPKKKRKKRSLGNKRKAVEDDEDEDSAETYALD